MDYDESIEKLRNDIKAFNTLIEEANRYISILKIEKQYNPIHTELKKINFELIKINPENLDEYGVPLTKLGDSIYFSYGYETDNNKGYFIGIYNTNKDDNTSLEIIKIWNNSYNGQTVEQDSNWIRYRYVSETNLVSEFMKFINTYINTYLDKVSIN